MTKEEASEVLRRIKANYQEFSIQENYIKDEWYRALQNYDLEDVFQKLDEHLRDEIYGREIPKVNFLVKGLIKSKDKGKVRDYLIYCNNCGQVVGDKEYDKHYKKCSAADVIVRDLKKYFNLTVKRKELMELSDTKFEQAYQKYLNKMLDADLPYLRKKLILQIIYPNDEIDIDAIAKKMANKD